MKQGLILIAIIGIFACNSPEKKPSRQMIQISGKTMGTTYNISYYDSAQVNHKIAIESLLSEINDEVSTYIKESVISKVNTTKEKEVQLALFTPHHFANCFRQSKEVYRNTKGSFDPTVMPLVNYWGFGYTGKDPVKREDSLKVDSLKMLIGFDKMNLIEKRPAPRPSPKGEKQYTPLKQSFLTKENPDSQVDFSAVAKGYAIDAIGWTLESFKISDYLVEIGGEVRARGKNPNFENWTVGINTPEENAPTNEYYAVLQLDNRSMATSGNYRNFYEVDGKKYVHTINPKTGYPELGNLLSASVVTKDCGFADAYATGFMVMGLEEAFKLAEALPDLEAYFIYLDDQNEMQTKQTSGMGAILLD